MVPLVFKLSLSFEYYISVFGFSYSMWMVLADDISEPLVGCIFRSSKKIVIIVNNWLCRDYSDQGGLGLGERHGQ